MRNLLSANFSRLRKNKFYYVVLAAAFLSSLYICWENSGRWTLVGERPVDETFFSFVIVTGAFFAVFTSMFLGTEYSDGTIRNKLIVGHTRFSVYLANFLCCAFACLTFSAAGILGSLPLLFFGGFQMGALGLLYSFLVLIGFTVSFCALFTLISMLCPNKALAVVLCLAVWVVLLGLGSSLYDRLNAPEFYSDLAYFIDGEMKIEENVPNPSFLSGASRTVCEWIVDILPMGQACMLSRGEITHPLREILSSVVLTLVLLLIGTAAFQKKDMK